METKNTPKEDTPKENTNQIVLTDEEKKELEEYRGDNPFMKSISAMYLKYGTLSEKQVKAFRKTLDPPEKKENLEVCPVTKLKLNQSCVFKEGEEKFQPITIKVIRPKALCMEKEDKSQIAWTPNKALHIEHEFHQSPDGEVDEYAILSLKDWFTKDEKFWKDSYKSEKKEESPVVEHDGMKYNPENPQEDLQVEGYNENFPPKEQGEITGIPDGNTMSDTDDDDLPF